MTMSIARSLPVSSRKSGRCASRIASRSHSWARSSDECLSPIDARDRQHAPEHVEREDPARRDGTSARARSRAAGRTPGRELLVRGDERVVVQRRRARATGTGSAARPPRRSRRTPARTRRRRTARRARRRRARRRPTRPARWPRRCCSARVAVGGIEHRAEAGVHVDRGDEAGVDRAGEVGLEAGPVDRAVVGERQQHRGHPGDRPAAAGSRGVHLGHDRSPSSSCSVRASRSSAAGSSPATNSRNATRGAADRARRVPRSARAPRASAPRPRRAGAGPRRSPTRRRGGARAAARALRPRRRRRPAAGPGSQYGGCQ